MIFTLIFNWFLGLAGLGLRLSYASESPPSIEISYPGMKSDRPPTLPSRIDPLPKKIAPASMKANLSLRDTSPPTSDIKRLSPPSLFNRASAPPSITSPILTSSAGAALIPQSLPTPSLSGQAFNYTFHDLTFTKSSNLYFEQSMEDELEPIEQVDKGTQLVSAVALTWNSQDRWSLGAHAQIEYDDSEPMHRFVDWLSLRASYPLWEEKLIFNVAVYKGIQNPDLWFQPGLIFSLKEGLSFSLRADIVQNSDDPDQGYLGMFEDQSRIFAWMEAQF